MKYSLLKFTAHCLRAVKPPHLQILRIEGGGMMNDVIIHTSHDVIWEKNARIVTFDLIGLLRINNIIAYRYIAMSYRSL